MGKTQQHSSKKASKLLAKQVMSMNNQKLMLGANGCSTMGMGMPCNPCDPCAGPTADEKMKFIMHYAQAVNDLIASRKEVEEEMEPL